jgi:hypothetical protein
MMGNLATTLGVRVVRSDSNRDHPSDMIDKIAYFAGLFDGEGTVNIAQYWKLNKKMNKKYLCWRIAMEIAMTDKETIKWCCDTFGGNLKEKPRKEHKMQYRWRRVFRDAYEIAKAIHPYAITKKDKLQEIIKHYE